MADKGKVKRGGCYCMAGGPNKTSCKNLLYTEVVSMHYFPSADDVRQKWTTFVRRHRKDFVPSKTSTLRSVHFEESCFEQRAAIFSGESANLPKFEISHQGGNSNKGHGGSLFFSRKCTQAKKGQFIVVFF